MITALLTLRNAKYAGIGLLILGAVWWHYHAVSIAYRHGATDREKSALAEAGEKMEAMIKSKQSSLNARESELKLSQAKLSTERTTINQTRDAINQALNSQLNQLHVSEVDIHHEIQSVPDDAVNGRFRTALERARANERQQAANN